MFIIENRSLFWEATTEELVQGYRYNKETGDYVCLACDEVYRDGFIYQNGQMLLEAKKAIVFHIQKQHGSMFDYLINMDKRYTGLSDLQTELMMYFKQGLTDKEIAERMGGSSPSTIRNHRFKLREKEKQAKVFLALMTLLQNHNDKKLNEFVSFHKGATMVDERYATTVNEKEKILITYFKEGLDGPLSIFPSKEKRKLIVLQHILTKFEKGKIYTEREINEVLKNIYDDFATIRRYLIEYGFLDRNKDGSEYWVKG